MIRTIAGLGLLATGCYAVLSWLAHRSAFFPMKYPQGDWEEREALQAEEVTLSTSDGVRLNAWWIGAPDSKWATLFLHGNAGNVTHRAEAMRGIRAAGSSALLLDYRGYGKSEGAPSERGLYKDADAAYEWLRARGYDTTHIVIHGESLGTAVAVELAARRQCAGLVLEAPFPSARAVAGKALPVLGPALIWGFDSSSRIGKVHVPLLVIQGDQDEVIDYLLGRELFAAAHEPKQFWTLPGAGHNNIVSAAGAEYPKRLREFYSRLTLSNR